MTWYRVTFIQPRKERQHPQVDTDFRGLQFHRDEDDALKARKTLEDAGCVEVRIRRDEW